MRLHDHNVIWNSAHTILPHVEKNIFENTQNGLSNSKGEENL